MLELLLELLVEIDVLIDELELELDELVDILLELLELVDTELDELDELEEELEELLVDVEVVEVSPPISQPYNVIEPTGLVPETVIYKTSSISSAGRGIGYETTLESLPNIEPLNNLCLGSLVPSKTLTVTTSVVLFPITM